MKRIFLIVLLSTTVFTACEDMELLKEKPQSDYALTNVNAEVLESLLTGAYEPLSRSRGRLWESIYSTLLESMAEYTFCRETNFFASVSLYDFLKMDETFNGAMWSSFYEAIGRSNFIISSLRSNTALSQDVITVAIGEASFIRAICYYQLVRAWGKVPLRLEPVNNPDLTAIPLSEISAIYTQIIADLQVAEQYLPVKVPANKAGRATQGAAKVTLADVYLTLNDFTSARAKAKEVMDNKTVYGYNLESSLDLLYSPTSPTNTEEVFAIKFAQTREFGSFLPAYAHDDRAANAKLAARGLRRIHTYNSIPLIATWDRKDKRRNLNLYDTIVINNQRVRANLPTAGLINKGTGDYFFGKYKDASAPEETAAGNDFYLYRYADVLLIYAEAENQISGPTTEAYNAVNIIRRRAYGVDQNSPSAIADLPQGLTKEAFDNLIFRERGYEFFFECKRWYDIKRKNKYVEIISPTGKPLPQQEFWNLPLIEVLNNSAIQ